MGGCIGLGLESSFHHADSALGCNQHYTTRCSDLERGTRENVFFPLGVLLTEIIYVFFFSPQKIIKSTQSRASWGPTDPETKREWLEQPLLNEQEEESRTTPGDKAECKLKKEVVAKLSQNEGKSKNQVNGKLMPE